MSPNTIPKAFGPNTQPDMKEADNGDNGKVKDRCFNDKLEDGGENFGAKTVVEQNIHNGTKEVDKRASAAIEKCQKSEKDAFRDNFSIANPNRKVLEQSASDVKTYANAENDQIKVDLDQASDSIYSMRNKQNGNKTYAAVQNKRISYAEVLKKNLPEPCFIGREKNICGKNIQKTEGSVVPVLVSGSSFMQEPAESNTEQSMIGVNIFHNYFEDGIIPSAVPKESQEDGASEFSGAHKLYGNSDAEDGKETSILDGARELDQKETRQSEEADAYDHELDAQNRQLIIRDESAEPDKKLAPEIWKYHDGEGNGACDKDIKVDSPVLTKFDENEPSTTEVFEEIQTEKLKPTYAEVAKSNRKIHSRLAITFPRPKAGFDGKEPTADGRFRKNQRENQQFEAEDAYKSHLPDLPGAEVKNQNPLRSVTTAYKCESRKSETQAVPSDLQISEKKSEWNTPHGSFLSRLPSFGLRNCHETTKPDTKETVAGQKSQIREENDEFKKDQKEDFTLLTNLNGKELIGDAEEISQPCPVKILRGAGVFVSAQNKNQVISPSVASSKPEFKGQALPVPAQQHNETESIHVKFLGVTSERSMGISAITKEKPQREDSFVDNQYVSAEILCQVVAEKIESVSLPRNYLRLVSTLSEERNLELPTEKGIFHVSSLQQLCRKTLDIVQVITSNYASNASRNFDLAFSNRRHTRNKCQKLKMSGSDSTRQHSIASARRHADKNICYPFSFTEKIFRMTVEEALNILHDPHLVEFHHHSHSSHRGKVYSEDTLSLCETLSFSLSTFPWKESALYCDFSLSSVVQQFFQVQEGTRLSDILFRKIDENSCQTSDTTKESIFRRKMSGGRFTHLCRFTHDAISKISAVKQSRCFTKKLLLSEAQNALKTEFSVVCGHTEHLKLLKFENRLWLDFKLSFDAAKVVSPRVNKESESTKTTCSENTVPEVCSSSFFKHYAPDKRVDTISRYQKRKTIWPQSTDTVPRYHPRRVAQQQVSHRIECLATRGFSQPLRYSLRSNKADGRVMGGAECLSDKQNIFVSSDPCCSSKRRFSCTAFGDIVTSYDHLPFSRVASYREKAIQEQHFHVTEGPAIIGLSQPPPPRRRLPDVEADGKISDAANDPPGQQSTYIPPGDHRREAYRLSTFESFPPPTVVDVTGLAKHGFSYTGFGDRVKCYSCGRTVEKWERGDSPAERRWHKPTCGFAQGRAADNVPIMGMFTQQFVASRQNNAQGAGSLSPSGPIVNFANDVGDRLSGGGTYRIQSGSGLFIGANATTRSTGASGSNLPSQWRMASVVSADHRRYLTNLYLYRELDRLASFCRWPTGRPTVSPVSLARSGFFYLGDMDRTQCFSCGGVLRNWTEDDDATAEHRTHFPSCRFVLGLDPRNVKISDQQETPQELATAYPCRYPSNPHMRSEAARMETFDRRWPANKTRATPGAIAEAGFFFLGERDRVKCWYCNGGLQNWEYEDTPWIEHAKWFPNCQFLLRRQGQLFVYRHLSLSPHLPRPNIARQEGSTIDPIEVTNIRRGQDIPPAEPTTSGSRARPPTPPPTIIDPQEELCKRKERVGKEIKESDNVKMVMQMGYGEEILRKVLEEQLETGPAADADNIFDGMMSLLEAVQKKEEEMKNEQEEATNIKETLQQANINFSTMSSMYSTAGPLSMGAASSMAAEASGVVNVSGFLNQDSDDDEPMDIYGSVPEGATGGTNSQTGAKEFPPHQAIAIPEDPKSIEEMLEQKKEERLCKICFVEQADMVFIPCSHMCCCRNCTEAIRHCPVCRKRIDKAIRTYLN